MRDQEKSKEKGGEEKEEIGFLGGYGRVRPVFIKEVSMADLKDLLQSADWKQEKHVPVIDAPDTIKKGEAIKVTLTVGKEIPHPNTTEHHISWIETYFLADGEKFPYQLGRFEFLTHGASAQGPNTSTIYTVSEVTCSFKTDKSGMILAESYCNIHGLWKNEKTVKVL